MNADHIEVTAADKWDYVEFKGALPAGSPRWFRRHEIVNVRVDGAHLYFDHLTTKWEPWTEAAAELKLLMDSWRAKGWTQQADEVEHPLCGGDDCDCRCERSIYDEMGMGVEHREPHTFALAYCRFWKRAVATWPAFSIDPTMPPDRLILFRGTRENEAPLPNPAADIFLLPAELPAHWQVFASQDWAHPGAFSPTHLVFLPEQPVAVMGDPPSEAEESGVERAVREADADVVKAIVGPALASHVDAMMRSVNAPPQEGAPAAPTWTCPNHVPPYEHNEASRVACEICGRGRGD